MSTASLGIIFFRIAAYGMIVTSFFHLVGHFSGFPPPANDTESTLMDLMRTYQLSITALHRTMFGMLSGYSFVFAAFPFFAGILNLAIVRRHRNAAPRGDRTVWH